MVHPCLGHFLKIHKSLLNMIRSLGLARTLYSRVRSRFRQILIVPVPGRQQQLSTTHIVDEERHNQDAEALEKSKLGLHLKCGLDDVDGARRLLQSFAVDIHTRDRAGQVALHIASKVGSLKMAKLLLQEGYANVDTLTKNDAGLSPLHLACSRGYTSLVRYFIIEAEASSELVCRRLSATPLLHACRHGQIDTVMALIQEGLASPQAVASNMRNCLHYACEGGHAELVSYLLSLHSFSQHWIEATDVCGVTPLLIAAARGHESVVQVLLKAGASATHKDNRGVNALLLACAGGHINIAKLLVQEGGVKMDMKDNAGWTCLHVAASKGRADMLLVLVKELGAAINLRNKLNETPLHLAAQRGLAEVVFTLLSLGANIDGTQRSGNTPLHYAALGGHCEAVHTLVNRGHANVNSLNKEGNTPLHCACKAGAADVLEVLLADGRAKSDIQTLSGRTALHLCTQNMNAHVLLEVLLRHSSLQTVNICSDSKDTALHLAVRYGKWRCVQMLLQAGADTSVVNKAGCTPLHEAQSQLQKSAHKNNSNKTLIVEMLKPTRLQELSQFKTALKQK